MPETEIARLNHRMWRLVVVLVVVVLITGIVAVGALVVAWRSVESADSSRRRATERITQLQARIVELEDRGLNPAEDVKGVTP